MTEKEPLRGTQRLADIVADTVEGGQTLGKYWIIAGSILGFIIGFILLGLAIYFGTRPEPDLISKNAVITSVESCQQQSDNKKWNCKYTITFTDDFGQIVTTNGPEEGDKFRRTGDTLQIQYVRGDWQNTLSECCKTKNIYTGLIFLAIAICVLLFSAYSWYFRKNKYRQSTVLF